MKKLLLTLLLVLSTVGLYAQSDIVVFSTNPDNEYIAGETLSFSVLVTNNGPNPAQNVNAYYPIPSGITIPPGVTKFWWEGTNSSSGTNVDLNNTIPVLGVNQTVTYTIHIKIPNDYVAELPEFEVNYDLQSDLQVEYTNNQDYYTLGSQSVYTISIFNNGPEAAQNVTVNSAVPAGITSSSWSGNGASGTNQDLNDVITEIGVGETVDYTFTVDVPNSYSGDITAELFITGDFTDPTPACNPCSDIDQPAQADIVVVNTDGSNVYTPGTASVYTVTVTNNGPEQAENVVVDFVFPAEVTTVTWTGDNGSSGTISDLSDAIGSLAVDETVTYTLTADVPLTFTGEFVFSAEIQSDTQDPTPDCGDCSDTNYPPDSADIVVVNTNGQDVYTAGTTSTYTVTVTNNGLVAAQNVVVQNAIPAGITSFSWTGDNGSSGTNVALSDAIAVLATGETVTYTITLDIPAGYIGLLTSETTVTSDTQDSDPSCEECIDTDYPEAQADIIVVNTNGQDVYTPGTTSVYTVTVTNNGPFDAQNVIVQNAIPAGITSFSWTGDNGSSGTNVALDDTIATLTVDETVIYTITIDIPAGYTGLLTSETTVTSDTTDPNSTCDECVDTDGNATEADLVISHTLNSGTTYTAGTDAVYTITITNQGPGAAVNVSIEDIIPAGLDAASASWYGTNGSNGTGNLNDVIALLEADDSVTYYLTIPVPSDYDQTADITNEVTVTSDTPDPTPVCTACTLTATPDPQANIVTFKTNFQDEYVSNTQVQYTITVTNPGPSDAYNVVLYDPKPYQIDLMTWEGDGVGGSGVMNTVIPVLPAGESAQYTVTIFVPEDYHNSVGPLQNQVSVQSETPDPEPDCPGCTDTDLPAADFVTVDKYAYTIPELVEDVLIDAECVNVSNIIWSAGNINGDFGIAYFERNNSNFPIKDGIVIRNGNAEFCEGQYNNPPITNSSVASGAGDADLLQVSQDNGNFGTINDVSFLQFDFVPLTDTMSFDFLFASNEYGTYQCGFSDVFAFLLTDLTDGSVINGNIAVIPGTNIPVSVTNIRDAAYNTGCGSNNVEYFGQYNPDDPGNSAINMIGQTVVMTASSPVVPGHTYKIKLAIGDYNDTAFDSAVFLEAGSFDIGQPQLPGDLTIANGLALCPNEEFELSVDAGGADFIYEWEKDGEVIVDGDGIPIDSSTITVTEPGSYTVLASFVSDPDCQLTDTIDIEVRPDFEADEPADILVFDDGTVPLTFDLTYNTDIMLAPLEPFMYYTEYYDTDEGIDTGEAIPLFPDNAYEGIDGETIYSAVRGFANDCYTLKQFNLYVLTPPEDVTICKEAPHNVPEVIDLTAENGNNMLSVLLDPADYTITYHETEAGAEDGSEVITDPQNFETDPLTYIDNTKTIYVRVQNSEDEDSYAIWSFDIIISLQPAEVVLEPVSVCELEDDDNETTFDLTDRVNEIIDASPDITVALTMHATQEDAENNVDPLTYPMYTTTEDASQMVYFRAIQDGAPDENCVTYIPLELFVSPAPSPSAPDNTQVCDTDNNGSQVFDLTTFDGTIYDGIDPNLFTVTYHESLVAAEDNEDAILAPESYTVGLGTTTIYARLTNNNDEDCYGTTSFNLTLTETPEVTAPEDGYACSDTGYTLPALTGEGDYYTAPSGAGTMLSAGDVITTTQAIYVYAESGTTPNNCTDEESFEVTIYQKPEVDTPADLQACEEYTLPVLEEGNYYTAAGGTGTMLSAGDVITTTQDLYIYANSGIEVDCTDEHQFNIQINNRPATFPVTTLEECDDNFDGYTIFNLTPAVAEVVNNQTGYTVTFHETQDGAEFGGTPIADISNYSAITGTIYIRVIEEGNTTNCAGVEPLQLIVHPRPALPTPSDYELCDDNNSPDGLEIFDLTTREAEITFGTPSVTAEYYTTQADAQNGTNPITNPEAYQNVTPGGDTIWVAAVSDFGCRSIGSFDIIVNPLPVINPDLEPFYACEEIPGEGEFEIPEMTPVVINGASGYDVFYYTDEAAALAGGNDYLSSPFTAPTSTIYARVVDEVTLCVTITPIALEVLPAPIAPEPAPLEECDFNNDNVAIFNIDPVLQQISNALGGNLDITVHETEADAIYDANPIPNTGNYSNIQAQTSNGQQTLYIRVQSSQTECFDIVTLDLIVHPTPEAELPSDYELCDNGSDDTDGEAIFDLTIKDDEVLGADLDPALYSVSYYETESGAELGTSPIGNPSAYQSPSATIWVRVTNNTTGCYDIVPLELIVNPLPEVNDPSPYTLCDENNPGDEQEEFDLTTKYPEIADDLNGLIFTIHHSYQEAQAGTNAIANPESYTNPSTTPVETLFVRVTVEATGCYRIVLLDVRVEPLPVLYPENIDPELTTLCDEDGDGIAIFDLASMIEALENNGQNLEVSFHETAQDALNNLNPITNLSNYQNAIPYQDYIYIRVANTQSGCYNSTPYQLELTVIASPQVPDLEDITQCDDQDNNGQDGQAEVDLTQQDQVIYDGLEPANPDAIIHYFTSEAFARAGAPRITNPGSYYASHEQEIWVRVEDPVTECYGITSFTIHFNQPLLLTTPALYTICETQLPNDGVETFDLTTRNNEILGDFGVGQGYTVDYYESEEDQENDQPIENPETYQNTDNAQTLYVTVTSPEGCKSYTTLTIKVLPLPTPETNPAPLVLCDDNNSPDGEEEFNLTDAEDEIRNNDNSTIITYHETLEDAEEGINPIASPDAYQSASGTIYVRVAANTGNPNDEVCYQVVALELIVNPLPELGENGIIPPNAYCEQNTDGEHTFILNEHAPYILGEDVNPEDYTLTFYYDEAAYQAGTALPNQYTNESSPQTIVVAVENNITGCITTGEVTLYVEEAAIANPVTQEFFECDYDGDNDGVYTFDLTQVEAEVLGTQDPTEYSVTYYESEADATAGENPITDPSLYTNSTPGEQEIWVRVTNTATISGCYELTSFTLYVEPIPEPQLQGGTICVDYDTNEVLTPFVLDTGLDDTHTFVWYQDGVQIAGASEATYTVTQAGNYTVEAISANGCISDPIDPVTIERSGPASYQLSSYNVSGAFSEEQTITITTEGYGDYEYQLDYGPWQDSPIFTNVSPGLHQVHIRDKGACTDYIVTLEDVSIIDYPRYFTPNGDGYHDYWNIYGLNNQGDAEIYIFDRYGKLIKQISSQSEGWDGTFNGNPLPADDYWFSVTFNEYIIQLVPLTNPDGTPMVDPDTGEPVMGQVQTEVPGEFKAHFALKR